jgi:hypothetical protein
MGVCRKSGFNRRIKRQRKRNEKRMRMRKRKKREKERNRKRKKEKKRKKQSFEFEFWLLLYAHRHRSILGAAGHILSTRANQLMVMEKEKKDRKSRIENLLRS